jgi:hypothetical protein
MRETEALLFTAIPCRYSIKSENDLKACHYWRPTSVLFFAFYYFMALQRVGIGIGFWQVNQL